MTKRYFVLVPGEDEREVNQQEWSSFERQAGFVHGHGPDGNQPVTAGFSGNGISGRVQYKSEVEL